MFDAGSTLHHSVSVGPKAHHLVTVWLVTIRSPNEIWVNFMPDGVYWVNVTLNNQSWVDFTPANQDQLKFKIGLRKLHTTQ